MNFLEAKNYIQGCVNNWESLKSQFEGKERQLLEQSYLVVANASGQVNLSEFNPENIALHHSSLFIPTDATLDFMKLVKKKVSLLNEIEKLQRSVYWMSEQIGRRNKELLQIGAFTIEVRFNQLDYKLIHKLKQSEIVDKDKTDMSNASIRVVLKGE